MIESPRAFLGAYSGRSYAFEKAQISIHPVGQNKNQLLASDEGYYDSFLKKVFLRRINGDVNREAIYDLVEEKLFYFDLGDRRG